MNGGDFDAARAALAAARREARAIAVCPRAWQPADLDEAYRLQAAVLAELGPIGGWKVAAITPAQQYAMGVPGPVAAALPAGRMFDASKGQARLRRADFIAPMIECEFAFQLGGDLPARSHAAYSRPEVRSAVKALRIAVEIVDPRLPAGSGTLAELGDGFNNGALIAGLAQLDWQGLDFSTVAIVLTLIAGHGAGQELARGSGRAILEGDPLGAVVLLANAQPAGGRGLRAGDVVTTGSCTGAPRIPGPGLYRAEFSGLGRVEVRID